MTFEIGDKVQTSAGLYVSGEWRDRGLKGKVVDVSNEYNGLLAVKFKGIEENRFLRPEYVILREKKVKEETEAVAEETPPAPDFDEKSLEFAEDSPEVQEALALILARIEDIKALLTAGPRQEFHVIVNEGAYFDGTHPVAPEEEEDPEPEPVFKKAKEVNEGDSLYTEAGAWDKVNRIETKDSGYTSLYGVFGNKIAQVPSGRVVQVLEPVS